MAARMKEGSKQYNKEAIELALSRVDIAPCIDCGHPVIKGYCCGSCGGGNGHTEHGDVWHVNFKTFDSY